jgi:DNA-binding response OmpR family regulator
MRFGSEMDAPYSGARILLVEDEPNSRRISRDLMLAAGFRVDLAQDGAEAVAMSARTDYALILMDMHLEKRNGVAVALAIRALPGRSRTPILAMSAGISAKAKVRCIEAAMKEFLARPGNPALVFAPLLQRMNHRQARKGTPQ